MSIFADEWQGLLGPFVLVLLGIVLITGLALGVGLGVGGALILRACFRREGRRVESTLRMAGRSAVLGFGGMLLGVGLVWLFRGDP